MTARWLPKLSRVVFISRWLMGPGRLVKGDRRSGDAPPLRIPESVGTGEDPSGSEVPFRSEKK